MKSGIPYCLLFVVLTGASLYSGTHTVWSGKSIQSTIDSALQGDTIFVVEGFHKGNIVLSKQIALLGTGNVIVRGSGVGSIITLLADSCIIRGLTMEHCGKMLVTEDAGVLVRSSYNTIEHNQLRDVLFGIYLLQSNENLIAENRIEGRKEMEQGERGSGIHVWNSHRNTLRGNTISWMRDGFYIQYANHTLIRDNEVHSLRYGLHYMYADSNTFLRNTFHDNVAGAAVMYSRGIVMKHNLFLRNRGFASYGILFQDCHSTVADSNVIADNVVGIFMESSTGNLFRNNIIAQNDVALTMFQNSVNNTFTQNNFIDNLSPLTMVGKRTESKWNFHRRGNYWSSYGGYDADADGVGDVPMKIQNVFNYLEGKNQNVRLYLYSPASQALAVSATAFPIIEFNSEIDAYPLMMPVNMRWATELQSRYNTTAALRKNEGHTALGTALSLFGFFISGYAAMKIRNKFRKKRDV